MDIHKNARLTPRGRFTMVQRLCAGQSVNSVARSVGVSPRTVRKWLARYRREGAAGLTDRSSRPHRLALVTPARCIRQIVHRRR